MKGLPKAMAKGSKKIAKKTATKEMHVQIKETVEKGKKRKETARKVWGRSN